LLIDNQRRLSTTTALSSLRQSLLQLQGLQQHFLSSLASWRSAMRLSLLTVHGASFTSLAVGSQQVSVGTTVTAGAETVWASLATRTLVVPSSEALAAVKIERAAIVKIVFIMGKSPVIVNRTGPYYSRLFRKVKQDFRLF